MAAASPPTVVRKQGAFNSSLAYLGKAYKLTGLCAELTRLAGWM
jgi:hypothetical protein